MTNETRRRMLQALEGAYANAADNAARARAAFRGKDEAELAKPYGESGRQCGELLAAYEKEERESLAALKEVSPGWVPRRMFSQP